jgi:hypothetical protein
MVAVGIKKVAATHTSSYDTGLFFNAFSLRGLDPHVNISDLGWQSNFHDVFDANFRGSDEVVFSSRSAEEAVVCRF